jgi:hypothetical protein
MFLIVVGHETDNEVELLSLDPKSNKIPSLLEYLDMEHFPEDLHHSLDLRDITSYIYKDNLPESCKFGKDAKSGSDLVSTWDGFPLGYLPELVQHMFTSWVYLENGDLFYVGNLYDRGNRRWRKVRKMKQHREGIHQIVLKDLLK